MKQKYLLDTCICAYWLRDKQNIRERINAVTAVAEDMIMVTENVKDFQNILGIQIENWIDRKRQQ
ncbi:MAG: hypothetical protein J5616_01910 [Bacteroidaceae bacterium]|nr:hypothetical protein [Bacteroidaceae bacterium]